MSEDGCQRTDVRGQRSEVGSRKVNAKGRAHSVMTEDRSQRAEDRWRMTEVEKLRRWERFAAAIKEEQ